VELGEELIYIGSRSDQQHDIVGPQQQVVRERQEKRPPKGGRQPSRGGHHKSTKRLPHNRRPSCDDDPLQGRIAKGEIALDGEQFIMCHFTFQFPNAGINLCQMVSRLSEAS
jgi:hypothetical protein